MALEHGQKVLLLADAAEAVFTSSEWTEVGYLTGTHDHVDNHPRLLRSLSWGDSDYKGHTIDAIALILKTDSKNLRRLVEYAPVTTWLRAHRPTDYQALRSELDGVAVPEVLPKGASTAALEALADAQALLESRGPTSALDRLHTGLHGYLRSASKEAGLQTDEDATAVALLKIVLRDHPAVVNLGPRADDVRKVLKGAAAIVDAIGTLRNRASLAHPNEELLDRDAALLAINVGRSLLGFLEAKLNPSLRMKSQ